jgi:hypothetical protein
MSHQVTVPPQDGVGAHQQPCPPQHVAGESVQQRREDGPVRAIEPYPLAGQLPLQHRDLVTEDEDLRVLSVVGHRQQPQHRQRVRHTEVRES